MVYCIAFSSKTVNAIASFLDSSPLFFSIEILYSVVSFSRNTRCGFFSLSPRDKRAAFFRLAFYLRTYVGRENVLAKESDRA